MKLQIFLLTIVLLVSGCVSFSANQASLENPTITEETKDVVFMAEAVPLEVKSGKSVDIYFSLDAKNNIYDATVEIYNPCLFTGERYKTEKMDIRANRSKYWKWRFKAGEVDFKTSCNIGIKTEYSANFSLVQSIAVLTETEYLQNQRTGKTTNTYSGSTKNPLKISLSFSSEQPFLNDTTEYMYINYVNTGVGNIDKLESGSVQIKVPDNIILSCDDYEGNKIMILNRDLIFNNKKAKKSTCRIKTNAKQPIDSKTLMITANYKYRFDNSLNIKIKPKLE